MCENCNKCLTAINGRLEKKEKNKKKKNMDTLSFYKRGKKKNHNLEFLDCGKR